MKPGRRLPEADLAADKARALALTPYDLALNVGICGSFDRALAPGSVVHVVRDHIAELGAEDNEEFVTIEAIRLPAEWTFVNSAPPPLAALRALPALVARDCAPPGIEACRRAG